MRLPVSGGMKLSQEELDRHFAYLYETGRKRSAMSTPCQTPFGLWLRQRRLVKKLTMPRFASRLSVEVTTYQSWEKYGYLPQGHHINLIAAEFFTTEEEVNRIMLESQAWCDNCSVEEYNEFIDMQLNHVKIPTRMTVHYYKKKRLSAGMYRNEKSGFNTYYGPVVKTSTYIPLCVYQHMERIMLEDKQTIASIIRRALELLAITESWPVDWNTEKQADLAIPDELDD